MSASTPTAHDERSVAELTAPMLAKDLWVAIATSTGSPEALADVLQAHLERMIELEEQGVLFASGPLLDDDGAVRGDGMTIIRAAGRAEAEEIVASDPLVAAGLRTVELRRWRIMEGRISVTLDFATGGYAIE